MILNEMFLVFYLVFHWLTCILYKNNAAFNAMEDIGNGFKKGTVLNKFFLGVAECEFCLNNWIATGLCLPLAYLVDSHYIIWGILSASISAILSKCTK